MHLGTHQNHGGLHFFPFRTSIWWRCHPKSTHKLIYKTASLSTTSPFSYTNGAGSRAWCRQVTKTLCFQWFWCVPRSYMDLGTRQNHGGLRFFPFRTSIWWRYHQHFSSWFQNRSLTQSETEHRFPGPNTRIREFLVRGGTESSQEPKVCEGSQNRPSTGPFQNVPGVP